MEQRVAIVAGATGMVGTQLVHQLVQDSRFSRIRIFGRRTGIFRDDRIEEFRVDFEEPSRWQHLVQGDVLFSALGTTIGKARSQAAQYRVDYTYQYNMAKAAADNGVPVYVLVSAYRASPGSRFFYTRMKGELDRDVQRLPFRNIHILQPGLLTGERNEFRAGEKMGLWIMRTLNAAGIAARFRPVHANIVAAAMINASFDVSGRGHIYVLDEVFTLAKRKK